MYDKNFDISDLIGFIISVLAVLFLIGRHLFRRPKPEEEAEQKEALRQFLKSLKGDMEELEEEEEVKEPVKKPLPPPPLPKPISHRRVEDAFRFQTTVEQRHLQTAVEQRHLQTSVEPRSFGENIISPELKQAKDAYALDQEKPPTVAHGIISRLKSKKEMVILQEILNRPRGYDRF